MIVVGLQTFSISPRHFTIYNTNKTPSALNSMTLQNFLTLTPNKYTELTGKKMTFKQKIAFAILKAKLKRQLPDSVAHNKADIGLLSLIMGGGAFVVALIPFLGVISIPMAIAGIVLGIIGLGRKKGDTKSIIGLVLGSLFLLLIVIVIAAFAAGGWY